MAKADQLRVKIRIHSEQGLNLAELGVLCTGVNRALQRSAGYSQATASKEPQGLEVKIESVERGSVIFTTLLDFFDNQVAQQAFLASILANASFEILGNLLPSMRRALTRTKPEGSGAVRVERIEPRLDHADTVLPPPSLMQQTEAPEALVREKFPMKVILVELTIEAGGELHKISINAHVPCGAHHVSINLRES